jgi:hypothetical protein
MTAVGPNATRQYEYRIIEGLCCTSRKTPVTNFPREGQQTTIADRCGVRSVSEVACELTRAMKSRTCLIESRVLVFCKWGAKLWRGVCGLHLLDCRRLLCGNDCRTTVRLFFA